MAHEDPEQVRQGTTVRQLREMRGLNVTELAGAIGYSYSYLSNIEAGRKPLTPKLVALIASALDVKQGAIVRPDLFAPERVAS